MLPPQLAGHQKAVERQISQAVGAVVDQIWTKVAGFVGIAAIGRQIDCCCLIG